MGFIPDIKRILALLPKERQSLLFSATFSEEIKKLADSMLRNPQLIEVARRNQVTETVTHVVHPVSPEDKRALLAHLIKSQDLRQALVFVGTKFGASRLAVYLAKQGIEADAIHGDKSQQQRTEALEAFKAGKVRVLVGTDVAARGLDIDDLPHVINFELPHTAEDYVHRIGRTGRAGKTGDAISLMSAEEKGRLAEIERLIKRKLELVVVEGFEPGSDYHAAGKRGRGKRTEYDDKRDERRDTRSERPARERTARPERSDRPRSEPRRTRKDELPGSFDWRKPYEPAPLDPASAEAQLGRPHPVAPRGPKRPVAALLGGLGKKPD